MKHKIEWLNRPGTTGVSWNPIQDKRKGPSGRGYHCTKISPGCARCWAETMNKRFGNKLPFDDSPAEFELLPKVLAQPLRWRKLRIVTVQLMGDLFHEDVSFASIRDVWNIMETANKHTFIVLTKRAERMHEFLTGATGRFSIRGWMAPLPNVIGMVTAENQEQADKRIPWLLRTPFAVRGASVEPMLESIDLRDLPVSANTYVNALTGRERFTGAINGFSAGTGTHLNWVICGAETGPGARPMDLAWARDLRDQCKAAGVPFFFKKPSPGIETPPDLEVREWPEM